jgi:UPF0755 protein
MVDTETIPEQEEKSPSGRRKVVAIGVLAAIGVVLLVGAAMLTGRLVGGGVAWDVEAGVPVEVTIEPGSSARSIYAALHDAGVARSDQLQEAASALAVEDRLQAGTYAFTTDMTPDVVIRQLTEGSNTEGGNTVTIIEGWTIERIIEALSEATGRTKAEFQQVLREGRVTSQYLPPPDSGLDPLKRWEGLLYPAKYTLPEDGDPIVILGAMADETVRRLEAVDWTRIDGLGVSKYEAITVASLIEREAGTDAERDEIASVIYNRLDRDMRLQIDATVIYALGYNPGRVTASHLEVESPYNTYRNDGLPPTPIGTASLVSIEAAVRPAITEYLFYVLGNADGSHLFAETYEGHQENIARASDNGVRP